MPPRINRMGGGLQPRRLDFDAPAAPPQRRMAVQSRPRGPGVRDNTSADEMNRRYNHLDSIMRSDAPRRSGPMISLMENGYKVVIMPEFGSVCASPWDDGALCVNVHTPDGQPIKVEVTGGVAGDEKYTYEYSMYGAPHTWAVSEETRNFIDAHEEVRRLLRHALVLFKKHWPEEAPEIITTFRRLDDVSTIG